ncbi:Isoflavone reductase-like protein [Apostasia shenzhenica]|uniref:Isoflavone reductase-like protein n=1 Tax=Apostasia shenzhenica TaxID=1088818 RepID=A0A2I0A195_9ASPA|nr:Isoflavone reductase-like protein [Apostasia shenzhenica]
MSSEKSKILVIGGTGYIGKFIVSASTKLGHPTFALVRSTAASDPAKAAVLEGFTSSGVTILHGDLNDHGSLVAAIKQVDVVISTVGGPQLADQVNIIAAIKEAGNIKRFLPSEFGLDPERVHKLEPVSSALAPKIEIRRAIKAAGIPYTLILNNYFAGYAIPTLAQEAPPKDKVIIFGDGNVKAVFVAEEDVGTYAVKAAVDPRTLNKTVHVRPQANIYSHNELISLWEKKTGKTLERVYLSEEKVLKTIKESPFPHSIIVGINYLVFVKGNCLSFDIDPATAAEATELYPDVKYTTVEEYLSRSI